MASLAASITLPPISYEPGKPFSESEHVKEFDRLCAEHDVIDFPVADGYAHYLVVSVDPPVLSHIDFCDGYRIPAAHVRGLDAADIRAQIERKNALKRLFSRGE